MCIRHISITEHFLDTAVIPRLSCYATGSPTCTCNLTIVGAIFDTCFYSITYDSTNIATIVFNGSVIGAALDVFITAKTCNSANITCTLHAGVIVAVFEIYFGKSNNTASNFLSYYSTIVCGFNTLYM